MEKPHLKSQAIIVENGDDVERKKTKKREIKKLMKHHRELMAKIRIIAAELQTELNSEIRTDTAIDVITEYFWRFNKDLERVVKKLKDLGYDLDAKGKKKKERAGHDDEDSEEGEVDDLPPEVDFPNPY